MVEDIAQRTPNTRVHLRGYPCKFFVRPVGGRVVGGGEVAAGNGGSKFYTEYTHTKDNNYREQERV